MFGVPEGLSGRFDGHADLTEHYLALQEFQHPISVLPEHGLELTRLQTSEKFCGFVPTEGNSNGVAAVLQDCSKEVDEALLDNLLTPTASIATRQMPSCVLQP